MTWCQQHLTNQDIFPTKYGDSFPSNYRQYVHRIMLLIWTILCHIYHAHWLQIKELKVRDQLQMIFMHIYSLSYRYGLLPGDQLVKLQPLHDAIRSIKA